MDADLTTITSFNLEFKALTEPHNKAISLSRLGFLRSGLNQLDTKKDSGSSFDAAIIKFTIPYPQNLKWATLSYRLIAPRETPYTLLLKTETDGYVKSPEFLGNKEPILDIHRLDHTRFRPDIPELGLFVGEYGSIILMKKGLNDVGFKELEIEGIELMYHDRSGNRIDHELWLSHLFIEILFISTLIVPMILISLLILNHRNILNQPVNLSLLYSIALLYGTVMRLVFSPFTGHNYDMEVWRQLCRIFFESGKLRLELAPQSLMSLISLLFYSPYALLSYIGFEDIYYLHHFSGVVESIFIKTPLILADLGMYYLIGRVIDENLNQRRGEFYGLIYYLSPLSLFLSGVWGMFDTIALVFFLLGLFYLYRDRNEIISTFSFLISGMTKMFGFLALIFVLVQSKRVKISKKRFYPLSIIGIFVCLIYLSLNGLESLPWFITDFLRNRLGMGANPSFISSNSILSYLSLHGFKFSPLVLNLCLTSIICLISIHFLNKWLKVEFSLKSGVRYYLLVFIAFYLLFFRVYEHYYLWIIPLLIIYSAINDDDFYLLTSVAVSVLSYPIYQLGYFLVGEHYHWLLVNLPIDAVLLNSTITSVLLLILVYLFMGCRYDFLKDMEFKLMLILNVMWFSYTLSYFFIYDKLYLDHLWFVVTLSLIFLQWLSLRTFFLTENGLILNLRDNNMSSESNELSRYKIKGMLGLILVFLVILPPLSQPFSTGEFSSKEEEGESFWLDSAEIAWRFYQTGVAVHPVTGLCGASTLNGWPYFTEWDLGTYIFAVLDAEALGLIERDGLWGSTHRFDKVLSFLETRQLCPDDVAYLWYDARTGEPAWSLGDSSTNVSDLGFLLMALHKLKALRPEYANQIDEIVYQRENITRLARDPEAWKTTGGIYEWFVAHGFKLFGFDTEPVTNAIDSLEDIMIGETVETYGVELPKTSLTSEPVLLAMLTLEEEPYLNNLVLKTYLAQKNRYLQTGKFTAFSEGNTKLEEPSYIYEFIVTSGGDTWFVPSGVIPIEYLKVGFGFYAVYGDGYALDLITHINSSLTSYDDGYMDGVDEDGRVVDSVIDRTNGIILSSARYALNKRDEPTLESYPTPFINPSGLINLTYVLGDTTPNPVTGWQARTDDLLGTLEMVAKLGQISSSGSVKGILDTEFITYYEGGRYKVDWDYLNLGEIATIGGPGVNMMTGYMETLSSKPFHLAWSGGVPYLKSDLTGNTYDFGEGFDYGLLYLHNIEGRTILVGWGLTHKATNAIGHILQYFNSEYVGLLSGKAMIVKWTDVDGGGTVSLGDSFEVVEYW
jgi:hypothetical protein